MASIERKKTKETREIERALKASGFPDTVCYRHNSASIRIRIIDERFRGKSRVQRENMVLPILESLPESTQIDITILLLLAPDETDISMMNVEFEHPVKSTL